MFGRYTSSELGRLPINTVLSERRVEQRQDTGTDQQTEDTAVIEATTTTTNTTTATATTTTVSSVTAEDSKTNTPTQVFSCFFCLPCSVYRRLCVLTVFDSKYLENH